MARGGPFSASPELATSLRWGLARVLRVSGGHAARVLISWDMYADWSEAEIGKPTSNHVLPVSSDNTIWALDYPTTHFEALIAPLHQPLPSLIFNVLSLLACLTAHSSSSGHTPPTLSPLFGPLLFGLGPSALPFHHIHLQYLRAMNAMEHVLFVGKTLLVTNIPARSAVSLVVLPPSMYPRVSKIRSTAIQQCSRNQLPEQGAKTGSNSDAMPAPFVWSVCGGMSAGIHPISSKALRAGRRALQARQGTSQTGLLSSVTGNQLLDRASS